MLRLTLGQPDHGRHEVCKADRQMGVRTPPTAARGASRDGVPPAPIVALERDPLPPTGGLPLGTALGITISILVVLVLGGLTTIQLQREERRERSAREQLLHESFAPLVEEIERAASLDEVRRLVASAELAEETLGRTAVNLVLTDGAGRPVGSRPAGGVDSRPPDGSLHTVLPVRSPLFPTGSARLIAWQDDTEFAADMADRRSSAWLDIVATVVTVVVVVQLAIYLLVTRPMRHLMTTIDKVEQGYPATLRQVDIARELRWLEWRFHRMSVTLTNNARLLVAAHRRAIEAAKGRGARRLELELLDPLAPDRADPGTGDEVIRRYLRARCASLEGLSPASPSALETAREAWDSDAVEAERVGELDLRARIENAALMILDAEAFSAVSRELDSLAAVCGEWCDGIAQRIESALHADGVSMVAMQRRTKHAAGVWRKMQEKNLRIEEVHDVFAFRIIVPDRDDCYLALNTVHRLFEPEPFRFKDYIEVPKANGYQSLHTSVSDRSGPVFEIQIRSVEMHRRAEHGDAAHWRYRAGQSARVMPRGARLLSRLGARARGPGPGLGPPGEGGWRDAG